MIKLYAEVKEDELKDIFFIFGTAVFEFSLQIVEVISKRSAHLLTDNGHLFVRVTFLELLLNLFVADVVIFLSRKMFVLHL